MIYSIFDKFLIPKEIEKLKQLVGLELGFKVAEVGAGNGEFAKALCAIVGSEGLVYASEFEEAKIKDLKTLAVKNNLVNLQVVESQNNSANLPEGYFNLILMRKVYHHFTDPQAMVKSFYNALLPGGKLIIIDFAPKWYLRLSTPKGIPKNRGGHGIKQELVISEVTSAGFKLKSQVDNWAKNGIYLLMFEK